MATLWCVDGYGTTPALEWASVAWLPDAVEKTVTIISLGLFIACMLTTLPKFPCEETILKKVLDTPTHHNNPVTLS